MMMMRMMIANDQAGEKKRGETCLGWARGYRRRRGIVTEWDCPQTDTRRLLPPRCYHYTTTTTITSSSASTIATTVLATVVTYCTLLAVHPSRPAASLSSWYRLMYFRTVQCIQPFPETIPPQFPAIPSNSTRHCPGDHARMPSLQPTRERSDKKKRSPCTRPRDRGGGL
jgi:hypothetical protein